MGVGWGRWGLSGLKRFLRDSVDLQGEVGCIFWCFLEGQVGSNGLEI